MDHEQTIRTLTAWLREGQDLTAARLAHQMRQKGVDPKSLICVRMFPDFKEPTGGCVITPQGEVFQFAFNRAGMLVEMAIIDEWINITSTFKGHPWRDDILAGLGLMNKRDA